MAIWTDCIFFLIGMVVGSAIVTITEIAIDSKNERKRIEWVEQMRDALTGSDFCEVGCGYYEQCHNRIPDKEDAMDELYHNYCYQCPIKMCVDLLEQQE